VDVRRAAHANRDLVGPGAGGRGKVYLPRSKSTSQPFAVKRAFLRNEDSRRDFLTELRKCGGYSS